MGEVIVEATDKNKNDIEIIMEAASEEAALYYKKIKEKYQDENIPTELVFQAMLLLMIDGLTHTGVPEEVISNQINSHLQGNTYFYTKEESKLH